MSYVTIPKPHFYTKFSNYQNFLDTFKNVVSFIVAVRKIKSINNVKGVEFIGAHKLLFFIRNAIKKNLKNLRIVDQIREFQSKYIKNINLNDIYNSGFSK